jgi:hypothetical protein
MQRGKGKEAIRNIVVGGHEAAAARGGERRRADAGAGRWEMGSDENGWKRMEKPYFYFRFYTFLAETGSGLETESNTDGEPEN